MTADVPVGAFLSGGIDSSTVVAAMQRLQTAPVHTFTIGFAEASFDEAGYAKAVARHLGTDHTELYVTPRDALEVTARLPELYDEPFGDSSQVPTVLLSQLARDQVTVALSGDGGDELFGGYPASLRSEHLWHRIARFPAPLRRSIVMVLRLLPAEVGIPRSRWAARRLFWGEVLPLADPESVHATLGSHWRGADPLVIGTPKPKLPPDTPHGRARLPSAIERIMFHQTVDYLPNDLLVKMDRASMSVGLEVRAPLLDHRLFEFASRLPLDMKIRDSEGKQVLRAALHRHVPSSLVERPKQGFSIPLANWLRSDLKEWAAPLLEERRLRDEGLLEPRPIRDRWIELQAGAPNRAGIVWNVLVFQAWLEREGSESRLTAAREHRARREPPTLVDT